MAASFYILAGQMPQAVSICVKNLHDYQLALLIAGSNVDAAMRAHCLREVWRARVLPIARGAGDLWLQSIAYWQLGQLRNAALVLFGGEATAQTSVAEPLKAVHHQYPRLTREGEDSSAVALARRLMAHHKVLQEHTEAETQSLRPDYVASAKAVPGANSTTGLSSTGGTKASDHGGSANDMFASFGAKPKAQTSSTAASAANNMFASFGAKPKTSTKLSPAAPTTNDMFASFGAKPKSKPAPAPAPANNDMFAAFSAKPKPAPAPAASGNDMFAAFGAKPKPKPSSNAGPTSASSDMFASFGAKPKAKTSSAASTNNMFAAFAAKPKAAQAAVGQPRIAVEEEKLAPLLGQWPPDIGLLEVRAALSYREKGFPLLAYVHFLRAVPRTSAFRNVGSNKKRHDFNVVGSEAAQWLIAQLWGCVLDLLLCEVESVETFLFGFGWSVQHALTEGRLTPGGAAKLVLSLRTRVRETISLLTACTHDVHCLAKDAAKRIRVHLDHMCRGLNFFRADAALAGQIYEVESESSENHDAAMFQPGSRMGAVAAAAARRQAGYECFHVALDRIYEIVRRHTAVRNLASAGLRRGCYSGYGSLDIWMVVQSLLDSAIVGRFATLSSQIAAAVPEASISTADFAHDERIAGEVRPLELANNLAQVAMCFAATLRRDHAALNRSAFLPLLEELRPSTPSAGTPAAALRRLGTAQNSADELQLYVKPACQLLRVGCADRASFIPRQLCLVLRCYDLCPVKFALQLCNKV